MRVSSSEWSSPGTLVFLALAIGFFGAAVGYVIGTRQPRGYAASSAGPVAVPTAAAPSAPLGDEAQIAAYRNVVANDPKNAAAAIQLGNLLYDAGRFAEAVPYYQQALALQPTNIDVSTDLGTALFYSGRTDEALAQYEVSLKIDASHPQTLFNIGVVRFDGKKDVAGAIEAWERLIQVSPASAEAAKARTRIEEARRQLVGFDPVPLQTSRQEPRP